MPDLDFEHRDTPATLRQRPPPERSWLLPVRPELKARLELWKKLTFEPRKYGFHATLKAPFHLSSASTEQQLINALENFAALGQAPPVITPSVQMLSGFVAVVPAERQPAVDALAASCVTLFDAYRAPMTPQERARRVAAGLTASETANLDRWGYPYAFGDFRFHMTLTGRIAVSRRCTR